MIKQATSILKGHSLTYWRIAQVFVAAVGLGILALLIFLPEIGIHAFWNVLIPIAPILFVVAVGLWRNTCPLASTSLISNHLHFSKKKRLKVKQRGRLQLISVILLLVIIPLRHTIFNTSGHATALILTLLALIAFYVGHRYHWKSAWCSSLCPIHPVEKLYGKKSAFELPNAHCKLCVNCVSPCPDSTKPSKNPIKKKRRLNANIAEVLMVGGFPGFIWGWFQVPDYTHGEGWKHLMITYAYPIVAMAFTLIVFLILKKMIAKKNKAILVNLFATAAVSIYYWYRFQALIGFGMFHQDGMLVDLSQMLPDWFPVLLQFSTTLFFSWWIIFNKKETASWVIRPPYANQRKSIPKFNSITNKSF